MTRHGFTILSSSSSSYVVTRSMGELNLNSRGAAGYWVENGEIAYPVDEFTIAGNLRDMLKEIVAMGDDVDLRGNIRTPSLLLAPMTVAGE